MSTDESYEQQMMALLTGTGPTSDKVEELIRQFEEGIKDSPLFPACKVLGLTERNRRKRERRKLRGKR